MSKVTITLGLEVGFFNGRAMNVDITAGDHHHQYSNIHESYITHKFVAEWPVQIFCRCSNKDMENDSYFDEQGHLVENKYVRLDSLSINGFPLMPHNLYHVTMFNEQPETFWDTNDTAIITLDNDDPISFLLSINNPLGIGRNNETE